MGGAARDYLADDFETQGQGLEPEDAASYEAFADYLRSLPEDDVRVLALGMLLRPFLDDDPRLGGTLYPDGDAMRVMDSQVPGDLLADEDYLAYFLSQLARDYRRWTEHEAAQGDAARWTLASGRPDVDACLQHVELLGTTEPPIFCSWADYLACSTPAERRAMCASRTARVNEKIRASAAGGPVVTADDIWQLVEIAEGRCTHCQSLCLQPLPYDPVGRKKLPWAPVGRRVGSVTHVVRRADGGSSALSNLAWSCLWCNTWQCERVPGATDHGGLVSGDQNSVG